MIKLLPLAGGLLLVMAALLPFRASASESTSVMHPLALALSRPLAGVVTWPQSRRVFHEPGVLLVVGTSLMGLGVWLRRATASRDEEPPAP
jgi:hypothetical protein